MPAGWAIVAPWGAAAGWPGAGIHPPALLPVAGLKWAKENRPGIHQGGGIKIYWTQIQRELVQPPGPRLVWVQKDIPHL